MLTTTIRGRRDVVHAGISFSKIRIHLDLIPSRTKRLTFSRRNVSPLIDSCSLVDEGAAFLMEPAALQVS
jgi:hypothetical protein